MDMSPPHKKIRLGEALYKAEGRICLITICTYEKSPLLKNGAFAQACIELLRTQSDKYDIPVFAYCFMPDHLHLLLAPPKGRSIIDFVRSFKSLSTHLGRTYGIKERLWQRSFYDHFLRRDEGVREVAQYILSNPIRKGLVKEWQDHPFSGSLIFELS